MAWCLCLQMKSIICEEEVDLSLKTEKSKSLAVWIQRKYILMNQQFHDLNLMNNSKQKYDILNGLSLNVFMYVHQTDWLYLYFIGKYENVKELSIGGIIMLKNLSGEKEEIVEPMVVTKVRITLD